MVRTEVTTEKKTPKPKMMALRGARAGRGGAVEGGRGKHAVRIGDAQSGAVGHQAARIVTLHVAFRGLVAPRDGRRPVDRERVEVGEELVFRDTVVVSGIVRDLRLEISRLKCHGPVRCVAQRRRMRVWQRRKTRAAHGARSQSQGASSKRCGSPAKKPETLNHFHNCDQPLRRALI